MTGITYRSYLRLPELLAVQTPLSGVHDELLFVTIHQASELWMKLCLHELGEARRRIAIDDLQPALKMMARVSRIQAQLIQSWEVLATMTPADYATMRGSLGKQLGIPVGPVSPARIRDGEPQSRDDRGVRRDRGPRPARRRDRAIPAFTTRRCGCSRGVACRSPPIGSTAISASPPLRRQGSRRVGQSSMAIPTRYGISTSSPKSWSISNIISSFGDSAI